MRKVTGKRIQKKSRKDSDGKKFKSAREANKEATRIKNEYFMQNGYANYRLTFEQFMNSHYLPHYQSNVEESTGKLENMFCGRFVIDSPIKNLERLM